MVGERGCPFDLAANQIHFYYFSLAHVGLKVLFYVSVSVSMSEQQSDLQLFIEMVSNSSVHSP